MAHVHLSIFCGQEDFFLGEGLVRQLLWAAGVPSICRNALADPSPRGLPVFLFFFFLIFLFGFYIQTYSKNTYSKNYFYFQSLHTFMLFSEILSTQVNTFSI
ncbi:UNVERIFIED_CONTAM: hypothetical protein K2H54_003664 [Gekko kuhli]